MEDAVSVREKITDARFLQDLVEALVVAALRQPDALRGPAEVLFVVLHGDHDLGAHGVAVRHERQEPVGR